MYVDVQTARRATSTAHGTDHILVCRAATDDASARSHFAACSFQKTWALTANQTTWKHTLQAFSPTPQAAEVADSAPTVILALDHKATQASWSATRAQAPMLAALSMDRILEECRKRGADLLWLTVWMQNHRAIAFYEKTGFRVCGLETFMFGEHA